VQVKPSSLFGALLSTVLSPTLTVLLHNIFFHFSQSFWDPAVILACEKLDLDTRLICKEINEYPFNAMSKIIDPNLIFYRNYNDLRPYVEFCEGYIEYISTADILKKPGLTDRS